MSSQLKIILTVLFFAVGIATYLYTKSKVISTNIAYTQRVSVTLSVEESGKVVSMSLREGDVVPSGTPVAQIDTTLWLLKKRELVQQSQIAALRAQHLEIEIAALSSGVELLDSHIISLADFVLQTQNRLMQLESSGVKGIDTQIHEVRSTLHSQRSDVLRLIRERDTLLTSKMKTVAQLDQTQQRIDMLKEDLLSHEVLRSRYELISPTKGQVSRVHAYAGDSINAGQPVVSVVSTEEPTHLVAYFDEVHLSKLRPGRVVQILLDSAPETMYEGKIHSISPLAGASVSGNYPNYSSGSFTRIGQKVPVKITFNEANFELPAGLSATVKIFD